LISPVNAKDTGTRIKPGPSKNFVKCFTYTSQYCIFCTGYVTIETFAGSGKGNSCKAKVAVEIPISLVAFFK
jgi:hypothetical protein